MNFWIHCNTTRVTTRPTRSSSSRKNDYSKRGTATRGAHQTQKGSVQALTNSSKRGNGRSRYLREGKGRGRAGRYRIQDVSQARALLGDRKRGAIDSVTEKAGLNVGVLGAEALPERGVPLLHDPWRWLVIFCLVCVDPATRGMILSGSEEEQEEQEEQEEFKQRSSQAHSAIGSEGSA